MADEKRQLKDLQRQIAKITANMAKLAGSEDAPTFGKFAQKYLAEKMERPTLRTSTKAVFAFQLNTYLYPAFREYRLDAIDNVAWLGWVKSIQALPPGSSITRFFNARKCLVEVMNAAKEGGYIERVPKLDNPDELRNVGRVLEDEEVIKILWASNRPCRFIFYVFWKLGCRPREILKWEWKMLKWNEPGKTWIDIPARISKTGRSRSIPINPDVSAMLYLRFRRGNGSDFVFPAKDPRRPRLQYHGQWYRACKLAKIENAQVYDFRRTKITKSMVDGLSPVYIARYLDTSVHQIEKVYTKSHAETLEKIAK